MTILLLILAVLSAAVGALLVFDPRDTDPGIRAAAGVLFGGIAAILVLGAFGVLT